MDKETFLKHILSGLNELPKGKYIAFDNNFLNGEKNGKSTETNKLIDLFMTFSKWQKEDPDIVIYFDILENDKLTIDEAFSLDLVHPNKLDSTEFKVIAPYNQLGEPIETQNDSIDLDNLVDFINDKSNNFPEA